MGFQPINVNGLKVGYFMGFEVVIWEGCDGGVCQGG